MSSKVSFSPRNAENIQYTTECSDSEIFQHNNSQKFRLWNIPYNSPLKIFQLCAIEPYPYLLRKIAWSSSRTTVRASHPHSFRCRLRVRSPADREIVYSIKSLHTSDNNSILAERKTGTFQPLDYDGRSEMRRVSFPSSFLEANILGCLKVRHLPPHATSIL